MAEDTGGAHGQALIIYKKVIKGGHGHHGGAWKVAYADMVTALMALFIVLWILGQSDEVIQAVAGYFRDPVGFREGGHVSVLESGGASSGEMVILDDDTPGAEKKQVEEGEKQELWREHARELQLEMAAADNFDRFKDQIELSLSPEGLRIGLVETNESPLFEVGGTRLKPEATGILRAIGKVPSSLHNHITIEGHTDSRPFLARDGTTNWELSTGRAHTARRVLERSGIASQRMFEVRGLANRMLYNPLDPEDSRNRRIAITVLSDEAYASRSEHVVETILSEDFTD